MKQFILGLLAALGIGRAQGRHEPAQPMHEASMNFDLQMLDSFIQRLERNLNLGIDPYAIVKFAAETGLDEERCMELTVRFDGKMVRLRYCVFMDDIDAPDVYFYSNSKQLTDTISEEYREMTDDMGI